MDVQISVRSLKGKNIYHVLETLDTFTITNQSIELTPEQHTILRFRRQFDSSFVPHIDQVRNGEWPSICMD